ncbi:MAG: signal peptidase II [Candidatus Babeliales bacterium]|jgi:signal peptidase II
MNYSYKRSLWWIIPCIPLMADRLSKMMVLEHLTNPIQLFPGFNFAITWNTGVSWSMLQTHNRSGFWLLVILLSVLISALIGYAQWRIKKGFCALGEMLAIGGALSNLVDRFLYGAVLDFIDVYAASYHFPTFNIADSCIFIGVCIIFIQQWRASHDR